MYRYYVQRVPQIQRSQHWNYETPWRGRLWWGWRQSQQCLASLCKPDLLPRHQKQRGENLLCRVQFLPLEDNPNIRPIYGVSLDLISRRKMTDWSEKTAKQVFLREKYNRTRYRACLGQYFTEWIVPTKMCRPTGFKLVCREKSSMLQISRYWYLCLFQFHLTWYDIV